MCDKQPKKTESRTCCGVRFFEGNASNNYSSSAAKFIKIDHILINYRGILGIKVYSIYDGRTLFKDVLNRYGCMLFESVLQLLHTRSRDFRYDLVILDEEECW